MNADKKDFNNYFKSYFPSIIKETNIDIKIRSLETLKEEVNKYYNIDNNIFSFSKPIEQIIFLFSNDNEEYEIVDFQLHMLYHFLGLCYLNINNYDDALNNFYISHKINPYYFDTFLLICDCLKKTNNISEIKDFLENNSKYIYNVDTLSNYYSLYGDYFFITKYYTGANILYSYSEYFKKTGYNQKKLTEIAKYENRLLKIDDIDDIKKYLKENGIISFIDKKMYDVLLKIYNTPVDSEIKSKIKSEVKTILYDLTKSDMFAFNTTIKNEKLNFMFEIPEQWQILKGKNQFESNTSNILYVIKPLKNSVINIIDCGNVLNNDIRNNYLIYRNNFLKDGLVVLNESVVTINGNKYIQVYVEKKLLNESVIEVHNYIDINGFLVDITSSINEISTNINKLYSNPDMDRINIILSSIKILKNNIDDKEFTFF